MALIKTSALGLKSDATNLVKLADLSITSSSASLEFSVDYADYTAFKVLVPQNTYVGSSSHNTIIRVKRDGQSSFDSGSSDYGNEGMHIDTADNHRNDNNNVSSIAMRTSAGSNSGNIPYEFWIFNANNTTANFCVWGNYGEYSSGVTTLFIFAGQRNNTAKITDIQISNTAHNISSLTGTLYGVKN